MHLIVVGKLDFETEPSISIMINATDSGDPALSFQKSFNITITDANDAPSDIVVTFYPVPENNTADRAVANLKVIDEDRDHRVRLCSAVNNPGFFFFSNGASVDTIDMWIRGSATLDFETAPFINGMFRYFSAVDNSLLYCISLNVSKKRKFNFFCNVPSMRSFRKLPFQ